MYALGEIEDEGVSLHTMLSTLNFELLWSSLLDNCKRKKTQVDSFIVTLGNMKYSKWGRKSVNLMYQYLSLTVLQM